MVRVRPPFKTEVVVPGYTNVVRIVTTDTAHKVIVAFPVCYILNFYFHKFRPNTPFFNFNFTFY